MTARILEFGTRFAIPQTLLTQEGNSPEEQLPSPRLHEGFNFIDGSGNSH